MAILWIILNILIGTWIGINVFLTIGCIVVMFRDSIYSDEAESCITYMCKNTDMNLFGKISCAVLIFAIFPLLETVLGLIKFMYWITHVRIGKEK